jgi:putative methionine-R-sulfoxide reductase with GAF domain
VDEREVAITRACEAAIDRLAEVLPGREVACLLAADDALRHVAHRGSLRLIFEVPRELGGVVWRTYDTAELQAVPDVAVDPDYVASDEAVRAEIAAPVVVDGRVVAVLDVESTDGLAEGDPAAVATEAERLADELRPLVSAPR